MPLDRRVLRQASADRPAGSTTEQLLARRWSRALGGVEVGPDDTFYDLGGSSLQVVEMLDEFRYDWAVALAPADLVEHPTLRAFAAHIDDVRTRGFRARTSTTIRLQEGSPTGPALFCVAGAGASTLSFVRLAAALEPDVGVYSLHGRGQETRGIPELTITGQARRQVREIRKIQADGVYHLTGHSSGAVVALECARLLRATGAQVAPLVLMDPRVPARSAPAVPSTTPAAPARAAARPPVRERLLTHARVLACGIVQFDVKTQQDITWERGRRSHDRHRLWPFDHPITIAFSTEYTDHSDQWRRFTCAQTDFVKICERHNDPLRDTFVATLCADLITERTLDSLSHTP
ncbi:alpha/beta fold hydrolase [Gordonia amarae]|uniref:Alpha/beta fold hydrolase n=2 Tax=Gordonia amarae TaxID=36821 RepID=A0A857MF12_9ACTN|nr:alpha/beta fold hydrolase [Gordonia amarae]MCS3880296.1 pimeloyl-ACP methyl ester carboxylesterase [Gordonia amarae]QHN18645.1 alpha/beta fold hydrolase [Gordonia amarae]QHN23120.1 alpha/beta fold hydrolase [Gordonia amarae]QHN40768.1 alpha/beta fold hydrolase [Gordonia amarae]GAB05130.1 putative thioesterase [Gordonia amarae NBRC 15530]